MKDLVTNFPAQLREAVEIGRNAQLANNNRNINKILISGLGGSGIGGTIVSELVASECRLPISVNKDYSLPANVDDNTMVLICSYSGNTEETLEAFDEALARGALVACVTSGGKVLEVAQEKELPHIVIPSGFPPRAAFAYSFTQLFFILAHYNLISYQSVEDLLVSIDFLAGEQAAIESEANELTDKLHGNLPILYSDAGSEGVAIRWRQQINENSKMLCWHHAFPEMNHNELVGWTQASEQWAVVLLRNEDDYKRTQKRMEVCKTIFSNYTSNINEVWSKGPNTIARALYLIHFGDFVSVQLAERKGIDPVEVDVITGLKNELANFE